MDIDLIIALKYKIFNKLLLMQILTWLNANELMEWLQYFRIN